MFSFLNKFFGLAVPSEEVQYPVEKMLFLDCHGRHGFFQITFL